MTNSGSDFQFGVDGSEMPDEGSGVMDESPSMLDEVQAALKQNVQSPPITLPVKARPHFEVRFDTNIDADLLQRWRNRWTDKRSNNLDVLRYSRTILANQCRAVIYKGQEMKEAQSGAPWTFNSKDLMQMLGTAEAGVADTVQAFYGIDSHIIATSNVVLDAAGYMMDQDDVLNPTQSD